MSFHNNRVLHGRDVFDPNRAPRHLQGCYVDLDDFLSRISVLEASVTGFDEQQSGGFEECLDALDEGGGVPAVHDAVIKTG